MTTLGARGQRRYARQRRGRCLQDAFHGSGWRTYGGRLPIGIFPGSPPSTLVCQSPTSVAVAALSQLYPSAIGMFARTFWFGSRSLSLYLHLAAIKVGQTLPGIAMKTMPPRLPEEISNVPLQNVPLRQSYGSAE